MFIALNGVPALIRLLERKESSLVSTALYCLCNITYHATGEPIEAMIAAGFLNRLKTLLLDSSMSEDIRRPAAGIVGHLSAGSSQQIQAVIESGIFENIRYNIVHDDISTKKEAATAVANVAIHGTADQVRYLVHRVGIIKPFCELVHLNNDDIDEIIKEGLLHFLKKAGADILSFPISGIEEIK